MSESTAQLGCSATLVLEMHRFEFWPLAIVMALSLLFFLSSFFHRKLLKSQAGTTPSENSGAPAMAPNSRTRYNRFRGGSYGKLDSECIRTISAKACTVTIHVFFRPVGTFVVEDLA